MLQLRVITESMHRKLLTARKMCEKEGSTALSQVQSYDGVGRAVEQSRILTDCYNLRDLPPAKKVNLGDGGGFST